MRSRFSFVHPAILLAFRRVVLPIAAVAVPLAVLSGCSSGHGTGYVNPPLTSTAIPTPTPIPTGFPTPTPSASPTPGTVTGYTAQEVARFDYAFGASDFNTNGQVVGTRLRGTNPNTDYRAFLYASGAFQTLGTLESVSSSARAVSENGQVAGFYTPSGSTTVHAFLYANNAVTDLGAIGTENAAVNGVNNNGQVVGASTGDTNSIDPRAFVTASGRQRDLGTLGGDRSEARGINDAGQIVGSADTAAGQSHAFLYENGAMRDLGTLGGRSSEARAINNVGQIVGVYQSNDDLESQRAFLYENGAMRDLGTGPFSQATDINQSGQIVGSVLVNRNTHAFVYANGAVTDLNAFNPYPNSRSEATAINDKGQILVLVTVGDGAETHSVILTPVTK